MTGQQFENWAKAKAGARATLGKPELQPLRRTTPWRARREVLMLSQLRLDIASGLPREALIERVDDMLFRLRNQKVPGYAEDLKRNHPS